MLSLIFSIKMSPVSLMSSRAKTFWILSDWASSLWNDCIYLDIIICLFVFIICCDGCKYLIMMCKLKLTMFFHIDRIHTRDRLQKYADSFFMTFQSNFARVFTFVISFRKRSFLWKALSKCTLWNASEL